MISPSPTWIWYFETGQLRNMKTNKWRKNLSGRRIEMGLCFAKRSLEGWGSEEKKNFFWQLCFSWSKRLVSWRKVHWVWFHERRMCFPEGKSIEFFFSNEERSSSERKKTQWTFLKDTILLLKDNIILLKEKTNGKSFLPSRSSSSLYNLEANNINWFYFPAPLHYFPPLRLYL